MNAERYCIMGDDGELLPCDFLTWARWFEEADRVICRTEAEDGRVVSTVFLGLDHRFLGDGPPLVFETMIFGGEHADSMARYATRAEAIAGHERFVAMIAAAVTDREPPDDEDEANGDTDGFEVDAAR